MKEILFGNPPISIRFYYKTLLMTKFMILFLFITSVQVTAKGFGQNTVTLKLNDVKISKVIEAIQDQGVYRFAYKDRMLEGLPRVSINMTDASIKEVLDMAFKGTPLSFKFLSGSLIVITSDSPTADSKSPEVSPAAMIHGKIVNDKGEPLEGVTVVLKNSNKQVLTKSDGTFVLDANETNGVLIVSFVGMQTQEVMLNGRKEVNITLVPASSGMSDVVVVGYGTQKKVNLTGAVASVKMDNVLGDRPITSTSQALQGAIPGLQITAGSGQPGTASTINIRGYTSINGGSPLVLVDNVPMNMDDVNPKDIDNISVLKDASAAAIYGARAAFGVILITTKQGARNQPIRFNYSTNIGITRASTLPQKATPLQFVQALSDFGTTSYWTGQDIKTWLGLLNQYQKDPGTFPDGISTVNGIRYPLAQTDICGKFFTRGFEQTHNFSFSGGSEKTNYRTSFAYTNQNGILTGNADVYKRYNFNSFINTSLSKNLTASVNVFYNNEADTKPKSYSSLFYNAITFGPYAPTGSGVLPGTSEVLPYSSPNNLVRLESPQQNTSNNLRLFGKLEYAPIKNLKIAGEYTFTQINSSQVQVSADNQYVNPLSFQLDLPNPTSSYYKYSAATSDNALNLYASYTATLAKAHTFTFLAGTNQEESKESGYSATRLSLITSTVPSISTSTGITTANDDFNEYAVSGYFGRFNYNYKNRYLFEATGRYDGSSRFPAGHRFGFFPAFSAGWNLTQENFMQPLTDLFPLIKLRGSYGEIGNQVVLLRDGSGNQDYYPAAPGLPPVNANWIDPGTNIIYTTLQPPTLVSQSFTWERLRTTNIGIDLGLLRNRLTGTFDLYREETLDMLTGGAALPTTLGTNPPLENRANLRVDGWDMQLNWKDRIGKLSYSIGFNLSGQQPAVITKFNNPNKLLSTYYVGEHINEIWGYQTQGYFTSADFVPGSLDANLLNGKLLPGIAPFQGVLQNPGDIRFVDRNHDGVINPGNSTVSDPGDRLVIGNSTRRLQYGITGNVSYGNLDLSFFVQGIAKRDVWISNQVFWPYLDQFSGIFEDQLNYWTPTNTAAYYPRSYANASGNTSTSRNMQTKYLSNGAYLRVKNISVGYNLPRAVLQKMSVLSARLFLSGENLITSDHLPKGLDPESTDLGSGGSYPFLKKYSFGVNINF